MIYKLSFTVVEDNILNPIPNVNITFQTKIKMYLFFLMIQNKNGYKSTNPDITLVMKLVCAPTMVLQEQE